MTSYFVRAAAPPELAGAFATRGPDGRPTWTRERPEGLSIDAAGDLLKDCAPLEPSTMLELLEAEELEAH